ncbi:hypothetical protein [Streptomyces scabiei]|uniref:hypothetical protein n=1 Tax=Streptomyces scabiei TaxID=1930 RepID=UPI0029B0E7FE|nr:hypothetical protein [Streptomyces scabiei]MDX2690642.1 hypothetical protein [Streptomyces scabiei]
MEAGQLGVAGAGARRRVDALPVAAEDVGAPDPLAVAHLQFTAADAGPVARPEHAVAVVPAAVGAGELEAEAAVDEPGVRAQPEALLRFEHFLGPVGPAGVTAEAGPLLGRPAHQEAAARVVHAVARRALGEGEGACAAPARVVHGHGPVVAVDGQHGPGGGHTPDEVVGPAVPAGLLRPSVPVGGLAVAVADGFPGEAVPVGGPVPVRPGAPDSAGPGSGPGLVGRRVGGEFGQGPLQGRPAQFLRQARGQRAGQGTGQVQGGQGLLDAVQGGGRRAVEEAGQFVHRLVGRRDAAVPQLVDQLLDPGAHLGRDGRVLRQAGDGRAAAAQPGVDRALQPGPEHRVGREGGQVAPRPAAPEVQPDRVTRVLDRCALRETGVQQVGVQLRMPVAVLVQPDGRPRRAEPGREQGHQFEQFGWRLL